MRKRYVSLVLCLGVSWFSLTWGRSDGSFVGGDCGTNLCGWSQAYGCSSGFQNGCESPLPYCCSCASFEYDLCQASTTEVCNLSGDYPACGCYTRTGLPCYCGRNNECEASTY
jgi:hypothetical protein